MADSDRSDRHTNPPTSQRVGRIARYFCYQCNDEVQPSTDSSELKCPECGDGFVEEMEEAGNNNQPTHTDTARQVPSGIPSFLSALGAMGHNQGRGNADMFAEPIVLSMSGGASSGGQGGLQFFFNGLGNRAAPPAPTAQRRPVELEALLNVLGNLGGINLGMPGVHGNPGDYVWGPGGLDAIITQLLNNVDGAGPPPADPDTIDRLPTVKITAAQVENDVQCFVCFDEFKLNEEVKLLPCKHHYHKDCITPWLERHGTCPVCRKDLQGSDTTTTEFDANIGETLSSIDPDQLPGVDEASSTDNAASAASQNQNRNNSVPRQTHRHSDNRSPRASRSRRMRDDDIE